MSSFFLPQLLGAVNIFSNYRGWGAIFEVELMVMGFNTEIKHNGVVYHIQTEPRKDARIETMVYLRGAIIHSLKTSYLELFHSPEYTEEKLKHLLEDQHRQVIARIRAGEIGPPGAAVGSKQES